MIQRFEEDLSTKATLSGGTRVNGQIEKRAAEGVEGGLCSKAMAASERQGRSRRVRNS